MDDTIREVDGERMELGGAYKKALVKEQIFRGCTKTHKATETHYQQPMRAEKGLVSITSICPEGLQQQAPVYTDSDVLD
jgi:hypothetical protein